jgi:uncharacterized membrane protein YedE/YeeE
MGKTDTKSLWRRILSASSPIRWAIFALFVSVSLFSFEVSLSFYQIYLSLVGGGVVVTFLTETISFVLFSLFGIAGLAVLGVTVWVVLHWLKGQTSDEMVNKMKILTDTTIPKLEKDVAKIKTKLKIKDDDEEGS